MVGAMAAPRPLALPDGRTRARRSHRPYHNWDSPNATLLLGQGSFKRKRISLQRDTSRSDNGVDGRCSGGLALVAVGCLSLCGTCETKWPPYRDKRKAPTGTPKRPL